MSVIGNMKYMDPRAQETLGMDVQISRQHGQIAEIYIGTPPQPLTCLVDSGSTDLWVPSSRCTYCQNNRYFEADRSSTFQPELLRTAYGAQPRAVKIKYGSGEVAGYSVRDTLKFGSVVIPRQPFIIVEDARLPPGRAWDGICGLGWAGLAQVRPTLYESIHAQGLPALFAIVPSRAALTAFPNAGGASEAHMVVGGTPRAVLGPSAVAWVPAETVSGGAGGRGFWIVSGGVNVRRPAPVPERFLVDTGTAMALLVPRAHYRAFVESLIPGYTFSRYCGMDRVAGAVCDCSVMRQPGLLPLEIQLGGQLFVLPTSRMFMPVPARSGGTLCRLKVQPNSYAPQPSAGIGGLVNSILGALWGSGGGQGDGSLAARDAPARDPPRQQPQAALLPPVPFSRGLPTDGGGPGAAGVVEDVTSTTSDGRVCKTERVISGGRVLDTKTTCGAAAARRLQYGSQSELWWIGGMFLEHFTVIFDFDNARLGFTDPAARRLEEVDEAPAELDSAIGPGSILPDVPKPNGGLTGFRAAAILGLVGVGAAAKGALLLWQRMRREDKELPTYICGSG